MGKNGANELFARCNLLRPRYKALHVFLQDILEISMNVSVAGGSRKDSDPVIHELSSQIATISTRMEKLLSALEHELSFEAALVLEAHTISRHLSKIELAFQHIQGDRNQATFIKTIKTFDERILSALSKMLGFIYKSEALINHLMSLGFKLYSASTALSVELSTTDRMEPTLLSLAQALSTTTEKVNHHITLLLMQTRVLRAKTEAERMPSFSPERRTIYETPSDL